MNIMDHADFSSSILFEASGDSEGDFDDPMMGGNFYEHGRVDDHDHDYDDDDDALSCIYDGSDTCNSAELNMCDGESCDDEDGDEKKEDVEIDGGYGASYCEDDDDDEMQDENQKSYVSSNPSQEFVDEMEKNRLFWEACLAS